VTYLFGARSMVISSSLGRTDTAISCGDTVGADEMTAAWEEPMTQSARPSSRHSDARWEISSAVNGLVMYATGTRHQALIAPTSSSVLKSA
jgi:hypothetical protein